MVSSGKTSHRPRFLITRGRDHLSGHLTRGFSDISLQPPQRCRFGLNTSLALPAIVHLWYSSQLAANLWRRRAQAPVRPLLAPQRLPPTMPVLSALALPPIRVSLPPLVRAGLHSTVCGEGSERNKKDDRYAETVSLYAYVLCGIWYRDAQSRCHDRSSCGMVRPLGDSR